MPNLLPKKRVLEIMQNELIHFCLKLEKMHHLLKSLDRPIGHVGRNNNSNTCLNEFLVLLHNVKKAQEILLKHLNIFFVTLIFGKIHFHELFPS